MSMPLDNTAVDFRPPVPRLGCRICDVVRQAALRIAEPLRRFTHAFQRYALDRLAHRTIRVVAEHLPVGWDAIKDLFKRNLRTRFGKPKLKKLRRLAIDEISIGHGHRYLTVVLDLLGGAVVFIGPGKGADARIPF